MQTSARMDTLVGLHVTDEDSYRRYREGMTPLLEACGGSLRYDLPIEDVPEGEVTHPMNRLFVLSFPDGRARRAFFENDAYREVRQEFFGPAGERITTVAEYEVSEN